jgi:predicted nucleic acid-binding protein
LSRVFVDSSALLALLVANDIAHAQASRAFNRLKAQRATLVTSSYTLLECYGLVGRRLGLSAIQEFRLEMQPLLEIVWIDQELHEQGLDLLLERKIRGLSLVDAVSFVIMERERIEQAFAFDRHFQQAGFALVK